MTGAIPRSPATAHPARHRPGADERARPLTDSLTLGALPSAVPCTRLHARAVLAEWGLSHLAEDAALIVSELMTNAVDASTVLPQRPPVALRLLADEDSLVIEVWDHSPLDPQPRQAGASAESGRGLAVVAALTDRWGYQRTSPRRKVVWAQLACTPTPPMTDCATRPGLIITGTTQPPAG